jgi:hypothetical protein
MSKTLEAHQMMKKALVALAFSGMALSAQAGALLAEGFEDVGTLAGKGWILKNASTPVGSTGWFQGDQTQFPALSGAPYSYAAANYNSAAVGGNLDNWLITPEFSTGVNGAIVSFWLRAGAADGYSDQLAFGFSNGSSTLSDFALASPVTVGTDGWARYAMRIDNNASGSARFALQYTGAADFSNYVGVDSLMVSAVPEPSTMLSLFAGALGLALVRRRKRG